MILEMIIIMSVSSTDNLVTLLITLVSTSICQDLDMVMLMVIQPETVLSLVETLETVIHIIKPRCDQFSCHVSCILVSNM